MNQISGSRFLWDESEWIECPYTRTHHALEGPTTAWGLESQSLHDGVNAARRRSEERDHCDARNAAGQSADYPPSCAITSSGMSKFA